MRIMLRMLSLLSLVFSCVVSAEGQWIQTGGPQGGQISSLAEDDQFFYAATAGPLFRMQKTDTLWTQLPRLSTGATGAMCLTTVGTTLVAGNMGGGVFRSTDHGITWRRWTAGLDGAGEINSFAVDGNTLFAGTNLGVYRSTDYGNTWTPRNNGQVSLPVLSILVKGSALFAGTWGDGAFRSIDGGRNWAPVQGDLKVLNVSGVVGDPTSRDGILLAAYLKGIFYSADGGRTWTPRQTGLSTEDISSLIPDPNSPLTTYALTTDGIFKSTDMGLKWQSINTGLAQEQPQALAVAPSDSSVLYASAGAGWVYRSDNQGERWQKSPVAVGEHEITALAVHPQDSSIVYAGSWDGVYRSSDAGQTWQPVHDTPAAALAIDAKTGFIFAADSNGGIWRGSPGGVTWTRVGLTNLRIVTLTVLPASLSGDAGATVYAGTSSQGVYVSRDSGATWQQPSGETAPFVQSIAVHPAAPHDLLVATSNGLYVRELDK